MKFEGITITEEDIEAWVDGSLSSASKIVFDRALKTDTLLQEKVVKAKKIKKILHSSTNHKMPDSVYRSIREQTVKKKNMWSSPTFVRYVGQGVFAIGFFVFAFQWSAHQQQQRELLHAKQELQTAFYYLSQVNNLTRKKISNSIITKGLSPVISVPKTTLQGKQS